MRNFNKNLFYTFILGFNLLGCGENQENDSTATEEETIVTATAGGNTTTTPVVASDVPTDSTGTKADISLNFDSQLSTALALAGNPVLHDLGNGIILEDVRLNIKSIKLKADKDKSVDEEDFRDALKEKKKEFEAEIEDQKKVIELKKEGIEAKYSPQLESAETEADKDAIKALMKQDEEAIEQEKAALEQIKDLKEEQFEYQLDKNIRWQGPYVYDALNNTITPEILPIKLVDGSYKRIEFKVKPSREAPAGDTLLNNSIVVSGTVSINALPVPFMINLQVSEEFRLMGAGAFSVDANAAENPLAIAFNVPGWFSTVDLTTGIVGFDGVILISEASNQTLYDVIKKNIKSSTKFGKDDDGDGKLEDAELEGDGEEGTAELELEEESDEAAESVQ